MIQQVEVFYSPQNDTAWTNGDNDWLEIQDDFENTGIKPRMLTRDGTVLISPFEQQFTLDIPIRLSWGVPLSYVGGVKTPDVAMKDKDVNNNEVHISAARNPQRWSYASGIQLDLSTFRVEDTSGFPTVGVGSQEGGYVYQGDILVIEGRYVFSAGIEDLVLVSPEIPTTLQITRTPLYPAGMPDKGYSPALVDVNEYEIENGTFQLIVPAASATNEYSYTMELLNLPEVRLTTQSPHPVHSSSRLTAIGQTPFSVHGICPTLLRVKPLKAASHHPSWVVWMLKFSSTNIRTWIPIR